MSEKQCLVCHNPAKSPNFDYVPYLAKVRCPAPDEKGRRRGFDSADSKEEFADFPIGFNIFVDNPFLVYMII